MAIVHPRALLVVLVALPASACGEVSEGADVLAGDATSVAVDVVADSGGTPDTRDTTAPDAPADTGLADVADDAPADPDTSDTSAPSDAPADPDTSDTSAASDASTSDDAPDAPAPECTTDDDCADALYCNGSERCFAGACFPSPTTPCRDALDCTVEHCDEDEDRCTLAPDDARCGPGEVCKLKVGCFAPSGCSSDAECDDGIACNGAETCADRACEPGTPTPCDDGVACTRDECVEDAGGCQHVPLHDACLATELCDAAAGCAPRPECDDADDCDDGSFCNGVETCDPTTSACAPGPLPVVADAVACTIDTCSEEQAAVVHRPSAQRCTNGLYCDGAEVCHPLAGCQPGAPPVTSDGVGCTVDACDEDADFIVHTPDDARCDNDLFCDGLEVCHPLDGCEAGEPPALADGVGCTLDTCSEVAGAVVHVPLHELCADALYCNGVEACDPALGCVAGAAVAIDDGLDCTADRCDEASHHVVHTPDHGACADADVCNGAEACDATLGCLPGAAPADGATCGSAPRAICRDGACAESTCGDLFVDPGRGEQCDDGDDDEADGCTSDCLLVTVGYGGLYDLVPDATYTCAQGLVGYDLETVTIAIAGTSVTVSGAPSAPGVLSGTLTGDTFTATLVLMASDLFGGCDETYTLAGTFTSATAWTGTFTRRFDVHPGLFAGCGNCTNLALPVTGTR